MFVRIKNKKAFTLVEVVAVIVIMAILLLIAVPAVNKYLVGFREEYYKKLEKSVLVAGKDYISEKRYSKPTELLEARIIKVSTLEDEGYIAEVKDYLGNKCDNDDTSYSYVIVVKTGKEKYDYTTCLKCSKDNYKTNTDKKENNYCANSWLNK